METGRPFGHPTGRSTRFRYLEIALAAAACAGLFYLRVYDIGDTFRLLGDQIRDWRIALGPFSTLPLVGPPSSAGGTTLGPIFYWILWVIRVVIGPFVDNLPHAGGIGLSLIQSAADGALILALARRLDSLIIAMAIVVFAATSPYDMVLSAIIWNPPLAVALVKLTIAAVLLGGRSLSLPYTAVVAALAWMAVQAHMTGLLVAIPVFGWLVIPAWRQHGLGRAARAACTIAATVLVAQIPYLSAQWHSTGQPNGDSAVTTGIGYVVRHPGALHATSSLRGLREALVYLLFTPPGWTWPVLLIAAAAVFVVVFLRRADDVLAVSAAPLAAAALIFMLWQSPLQSYWYMVIVPSAALTLLVGTSAIPNSLLRTIVEAALLAAAIVWLPSRVAASRTTAPFPEYGALVRASRQIAAQAPTVRRIEAPFLPPTTDPAFLYQILGGRLSRDAGIVAGVTPQGIVSYRKLD